MPVNAVGRRINTALILAIRIAKNPQQAAVVAAQQKEYKRIDNESRPDTVRDGRSEGWVAWT
jgi:hypothetical protein